MKHIFVFNAAESADDEGDDTDDENDADDDVAVEILDLTQGKPVEQAYPVEVKPMADRSIRQSLMDFYEGQYDMKHPRSVIPPDDDDSDPLPLHRSDSVRQLRKRTQRRLEFKRRAAKAVDVIRRRTKAIQRHCCNSITERAVCDAHIQRDDQTMRQRTAWLFNKVKEHDDDTEWKEPAVADPLCTVCFVAYHGYGKSTYTKVKKLQMNGAQRLPPRAYKTTRRVTKRLRARVWLTRFVKMVGDTMPHKRAVQLPVYKLVELHQVYSDECAITEVDAPLGYDAFLKEVRRSSVKLLVTKRKEFSQCVICNYNKQQQAKQKTNPLAHKYKLLQDKHRAHVAVSKEKYYKHISKSKSVMYVGKYLSIIFDGMDQAKTKLPHLCRLPKCLDKQDQLTTHITGVIVHGYIHRLITWVDNFPKDPNMSATILLETLKELQSMEEIKVQGGLPRKLYLQLDNCGGENKNSFLMTFVAILVHFGVFEKIKVSFLMVGHTHEDIDQFFSRLSVLWNPTDMYSIPQLLEVADFATYTATKVRRMGRVAAVDGQPKCTDHRTLTSVADVKTWMKPLLVSWSGISQFRCFVFNRRANGETVMRVRSCMCSYKTRQCPEHDKAWQPRHPSMDISKDGFVLFTPEQADALDPSKIGLVPPKPLELKRETIEEYFHKLLAYGRAFDREANDDETDLEEADLNADPADDSGDDIGAREKVARQLQRDKLTEGMAWFKEFFEEQERIQLAMCLVCRDLRQKEVVAKARVLQEEIAKSMNTVMAEVRARQQGPISSEDMDGAADDDGQPNEVEDEDMQDEEVDLTGIVGEPKQKKTSAGVKLQRVRDELALHMLETTADGTHGYYDVGDVFTPADRNIGAAEQPLDEVKVDYIKEDDYQCALSIGSARAIRKVHKIGCVIDDLVALKTDEPAHPFFVAKVLGRTEVDSERRISIQYYGNYAESFDGVQLPGWIDVKNKKRYYLARKTNHTHTMYTGEVWIDSIITWSSDWDLKANNHLPDKAKNRIELTLTKAVYNKNNGRSKKKNDNPKKKRPHQPDNNEEARPKKKAKKKHKDQGKQTSKEKSKNTKAPKSAEAQEAARKAKALSNAKYRAKNKKK